MKITINEQGGTCKVWVESPGFPVRELDYSDIVTALEDMPRIVYAISEGLTALSQGAA